MADDSRACGIIGRSALARRLIAAVLAISVVACSKAPPETRLRERIATMQAAIEARESGGFMDGVAEDFVGEGGMDRRQLRGLIAAQMLRSKSVGVSVVSMDVRMLADQREAKVALEVVLTGGSGLLPDRVSSYRIRTAWRDAAGWQLLSADWERRL